IGGKTNRIVVKEANVLKLRLAAIGGQADIAGRIFVIVGGDDGIGVVAEIDLDIAFGIHIQLEMEFSIYNGALRNGLPDIQTSLIALVKKTKLGIGGFDADPIHPQVGAVDGGEQKSSVSAL